MDLNATRYIAISHVWGQATWQTVSGLGGDLLLSAETASFLQYELPSIIGNDWFWMDILCIDQRNTDARIAVTQHIPTIFRTAQKTLIIKTSTDICYCCRDAATDMKKFVMDGATPADKYESGNRLADHREERPTHLARLMNGVLGRLWPLQEILLSDHLEIVQCKKGHWSNDDIFGTNYNWLRELGNTSWSLATLAGSWARYGDFKRNPALEAEFFRAFVENGCLSRGNRVTSVHLSQLLPDHMFSSRRTSKPRDFILATMTHYHWFSVPKNAKVLTFGELFVDCCEQAKAAGIRLTPLLSKEKAILEDIIRGNVTATDDIPSPVCVGSFVRLFDYLQSPLKEEETFGIHDIAVEPVLDVIAGQRALQVIRASMAFSPLRWEMTLLPAPRHGTESRDDIGILDTIHLARSMLVLIHDLPFREAGMDAGFRGELEQKFLDALNSHLGNLMLTLTAMIGCGLDHGAYDWVRDNLRPLLIDYHGRPLLVLAWKELVDEHGGGHCRFYVTESVKRTFLMAQQSSDTSMYTKCLFAGRFEEQHGAVSSIEYHLKGASTKS
jgi:Heterokaryon incompatibility protein (HET)